MNTLIKKISLLILHVQATNFNMAPLVYNTSPSGTILFSNPSTTRIYYPISSQMIVYPQNCLISNPFQPALIEVPYYNTQLNHICPTNPYNHIPDGRIPSTNQFSTASTPRYDANYLSVVSQDNSQPSAANRPYLGQHYNVLNPNYDSSIQVTFKEIEDYFKTRKFINIASKHMVDIFAYDFGNVSKQLHIKSDKKFPMALQEIIHNEMSFYKLYEKLEYKERLADLIVNNFYLDDKNSILFTIFISFFSRGFKNYTPKNHSGCIDCLLKKTARNKPFSDKSLLYTIEIWKTYHLTFHSFKEAYDILVTLGTYFMFDDFMKNACSLAYSYKKYVFNSLRLFFNN
ncbi:hypothetical protein TUBRATIS_007880 [Tubulinosema ratisbonensis]|uniref:Uncharacterized protein n=1 Tax=Tubulinosema ratisbonensis TaxID=291195 RepID=A0A437ANR1_9MICR|nr:hypothetical protein TUBRATIS_007880 [Tubulinosema ratisbonensis]